MLADWWELAFYNARWRGNEQEARRLTAKAQRLGRKTPKIAITIGKYNRRGDVLNLTFIVQSRLLLPARFNGQLSVKGYYSSGTYQGPRERWCGFYIKRTSPKHYMVRLRNLGEIGAIGMSNEVSHNIVEDHKHIAKRIARGFAQSILLMSVIPVARDRS